MGQCLCRVRLPARGGRTALPRLREGLTVHQDAGHLPLRYLSGYPETLTSQVARLLSEDRLGAALLARYPEPHDLVTDRALYRFATDLKSEFLRNAPPLSKVLYDAKITLERQALGLHSFQSRVQGARLKAKNEIRVATLFRLAPLEFLRMIVVHELAHLKEREHDKAFYKLCEHMEPNYHQLEFDVRLYLTLLDRGGSLYEARGAESPVE